MDDNGDATPGDEEPKEKRVITIEFLGGPPPDFGKKIRDALSGTGANARVSDLLGVAEEDEDAPTPMLLSHGELACFHCLREPGEVRRALTLHKGTALCRSHAESLMGLA